MTNSTTKRKRSLASRFIIQYDAIAYDSCQVAHDLKLIFKNNKELKEVIDLFEDSANRMFYTIGLLCDSSEFSRIIDQSKSKAAKDIAHEMEFLEQKLECYIQIMDKGGDDD